MPFSANSRFYCGAGWQPVGNLTIDNASLSVQEPGCARFDVMQQADDPTRFVLVEIYRDAQGHAAHRESAHYRAWSERVADMLAEPRTRSIYRNLYPAGDAF
jgi:(4S)-4-hydroxy-5-phosphonooxypentane-2,3-dione isomerase